MIDSHGRIIDYMRISITDRCNLRCRYCTPEDLPSIGHAQILRFEEILEISRCAVSLGIKKFKVTGGEPLVRKDCIPFLRSLKQLPGTEQVTITTNGVLLEDCLCELEEIGIDGINISLDTPDPKTYEAITGRDEFSGVFRAILACQQSKIPTKINCVLLKGINDGQLYDLLHLARDYHLDVRFIELMPIGCGRNYTGYCRADLIRLISEKYPDYEIVTKSCGNGPASYISIPGFQGRIGFIDAIHGKFCTHCNRIRLTSDGILKPCLYYQNGTNLKTLLRSGSSMQEITSAIENAILRKPSGHCFRHTAKEGIEEQKNMSQIGG
ncbi:MAG: GTP 3',8-cyclase MoaA [Lachnospiraceae bacterium]